MQPADSRTRWPAWATAAVFVFASLLAGGTAAGPGLTWDEPAYRGSQTLLQEWLGEFRRSGDLSMLSAEQIRNYWEYNRFGPNFHPPMAGYLNLATYYAFGSFVDDVFARRLASALEFAGVVAMLSHFLGRRYGGAVGLFAGATLLTMPRLMGDAHLIGTDVPLLFFWVAASLAMLKGFESRGWQWVCGVLAACLFLVKFSGVVLVAPMAVWFVATQLIPHWRSLGRWLLWSAAILVPLLPTALLIVLGARHLEKAGAVGDLVRTLMSHQLPFALMLLWPLAVVCVFYTRERETPYVGWSRSLELPWVVLAVAPPLCVLLNPTWWHDTVPSLASFFDLNINRQGKLPDIGIFYLGGRYLYSLPWHNALVLMAVTIPFGALLFGLAGIVRAFREVRTDSLPLYFVLQMLTLPLFRMLPTPAHDGVRLFLPTFFYWAGLAAIGAAWIATLLPFPRRVSWAMLVAVGPFWAGIDWIRVHPYELSYYNIGLSRAVDAGFETSYWYDAVTPAVLRDLNEGPHRLPEKIPIVVQIDPLINTETFFALQSLGKLRSDLDLNPTDRSRFNWAFLLSHSSKATPYTRLAYAVQPWMETGHAGVRLFSVVDPHGMAVAWALWQLTVEGEKGPRPGVPTLFEPAFAAAEADWQAAYKAYVAREQNAGGSANAQALLRFWRDNPRTRTGLQFVQERDADALRIAVGILGKRSADVRRVLEYPGYLRPEKFGGWFPIAKESK